MKFWRSDKRGSVLILVLWLLILLGVMGLSYSASVRTQLQIARSSRNRREAYWAARAGIERARAELMHSDLKFVAWNSPILDSWEAFVDQPVGQGKYTLIVPGTGGEPTRFGLVDECSRVNLNVVNEGQMMMLPGMTQEMAESVLDWRDSNRAPMPMGAEDEYYESLDDPYFPRNAPLQSIRELVKVKGWDPVLYTVDPDPYSRFLPSDERPETVDKVEAELLMREITVWSASNNNAPDGLAKLNLNSASEGQMRSRVPNMTTYEANAITNYRKTKSFRDATELLDVPATTATGATPTPTPTPTPAPGRGSSSSTSSRSQPVPASQLGTTSGPPFPMSRLAEVIDYFTADTRQDQTRPGTINVNTAPRDVLMAIPGVTDQIADQILLRREGMGPFEGAGMVATVPGVTSAVFKRMYPEITTTPLRFHVTSVGQSGDNAGNTAGVATIEAVLAVNGTSTEIVYWREN